MSKRRGRGHPPLFSSSTTIPTARISVDEAAGLLDVHYLTVRAWSDPKGSGAPDLDGRILDGVWITSSSEQHPRPLLTLLRSEIEEIRRARLNPPSQQHRDEDETWLPQGQAWEKYPHAVGFRFDLYRNLHCHRIGRVLRAKEIPTPASWRMSAPTVWVYHANDLRAFPDVRPTRKLDGAPTMREYTIGGKPNCPGPLAASRYMVGTQTLARQFTQLRGKWQGGTGAKRFRVYPLAQLANRFRPRTALQDGMSIHEVMEAMHFTTSKSVYNAIHRGELPAPNKVGTLGSCEGEDRG